jgi:hypothetical protein
MFVIVAYTTASSKSLDTVSLQKSSRMYLRVSKHFSLYHKRRKRRFTKVAVPITYLAKSHKLTSIETIRLGTEAMKTSVHRSWKPEPILIRKKGIMWAKK